MKNDDTNLKQKILAGERVARDEAVRLFSWDLLELGMCADARRGMIWPHDTVGFIVDRIINFTNVCEAACAFCAYHARAGFIEKYDMSVDEILAKTATLVEAGGTQVMLQGGLHPDYTLQRYCGMLRAVRGAFPDIYIHSFSPAETVYLAKKEGLTVRQVIAALKDAGLDSMPGASDILVDRIRRTVSPRKLTKDEWCAVMRELAHFGMKSSATMTYGLGETLEERIEHLDVIRGVQDETGVIRAFIPWSFSPRNTRMDDALPATGMDFLRMVAVARIYLDNVVFLQSGWLTEGLKLAQIALSMGANDMGGVLTEEVVVKATGIATKTNRDELVAIIKDAGKVPVQRDSDYAVIRSFE